MTQETVSKTQKERVLRLTNRCDLLVEGVCNVVRFEEESILLDTDLGMLEVDGAQLKIVKLDPEKQEIRIGGTVHALFYVEPSAKKKGLFRR